ncbi:MAG: HIT family protein [Betaproteobacteria bacterium]|nr:HIT family protein [Betaproteobacteria bacterium]
MTTESKCELCQGDGGRLLFRSDKWRVVAVEGLEGESFPGFCRVVWNEHVRELTDLSAADRQEFMEAVFRVEAALRGSLNPHKMNIASLGNLTPHLHWHVIPRFADDPAFPKPIWAVTLSSASLDKLAVIKDRRPADGASWEQAVIRALE